MSQSKTWDSATLSDLLVALITTTSILSDMSASEKEEVVAFMKERGYATMSWDKIRYVCCSYGPAKLLPLPDVFPQCFSQSLLILDLNHLTLRHQRISAFRFSSSTSPFFHNHINPLRMGNRTSQNWDEPALVKDLLAAAINHLNPSKQDILQIATKAKAMGAWQFTEGAC